MSTAKKRNYIERFSARLSKSQVEHVKLHGNPSEYLRKLIDKDMKNKLTTKG